MFPLSRTRLLAITLALVAAFYFTQDAVTGLLSSPFASRLRTRQALERKVAESDRDVARIEHAQAGLQAAYRQSLPPDPSVAVALYQEWLIQLAQEAGLSHSVVTPGVAIPEREFGHRIPMTLQATASTPEIAHFLEQFQQAPLLHRVLHLSLLHPHDQDAPHQLRATIQLEAISLTGIEPRQTLFPMDQPPTPAGDKNTQLVQHLSERLLFDRPEPAKSEVPAEDPADSTPDRVNPLTQIRFVGTWRSETGQEAWFLNEEDQREIIVTGQTPLTVDSLTGRLLSVTHDSVTLDVAGQTRRLNLGETLETLGDAE